jgi:hypothetical protein
VLACLSESTAQLCAAWPFSLGSTSPFSAPLWSPLAPRPPEASPADVRGVGCSDGLGLGAAAAAVDGNGSRTKRRSGLSRATKMLPLAAPPLSLPALESRSAALANGLRDAAQR